MRTAPSLRGGDTFDSQCGDNIVDVSRGELCDGNEIDGIPCSDECLPDVGTLPEGLTDPICVGGGCGTCTGESDSPEASLRAVPNDHAQTSLLGLLLVTLATLGLWRRIKHYQNDNS